MNCLFKSESNNLYSIRNSEIAVDPQARQPLENRSNHDKHFIKMFTLDASGDTATESPNPVRPIVVRYSNYPPLSRCQTAFIVAPKESIVGHSRSNLSLVTLFQSCIAWMHTYVRTISEKGILFVSETFRFVTSRLTLK